MTEEECGLLCEQKGEQKTTKARNTQIKQEGKQQMQHRGDWMIIVGETECRKVAEHVEEYKEQAKLYICHLIP